MGVSVSQGISMPDRPPPFFVGDHLVLDFLNSIASPKDVPVEWLRDGRDLVDWLEQANVIAVDVAARFRQSKDQRARRRSRECPGVPGLAARVRHPAHGQAAHPARGEGPRPAERTARGGRQLPGGRGGRWRAGAAAAAGPALAVPAANSCTPSRWQPPTWSAPWTSG